MNAAAMQVQALAATFGAEVAGLDLRQLDAGTAAAAVELIDRHRVVVFRDQHLRPVEQLSFSRRLGPLYRMPYIAPLPGHPDLIAVLKEASEVQVSPFGGWWHADFSYLAEPPVYSLLQAVELPPAGGDTLFADCVAAYAALSPALRRLLAGRRAMHSGHIYGTAPPADGTPRGVQISRGHAEADVERAHPLVRVHPPSGRPALFANPTYTTRFEHMHAEESAPLLEFLYAHMTRPEFTLRQRWQPGDLLVWDNRAVMHLAVNDYDGHRRLLHRTTVAGEAPQPAAG